MPNICNNTCLVKSTNYILHINVGKLFHTHIYNKNKMPGMHKNSCKIIYLQKILFDLVHLLFEF